MGDPHGDPQTSPQHADPHGFLVWFSLRRHPSPCGLACCRLVCRLPCGSPMWGGGKFRHGLLEKSLTKTRKNLKICHFRLFFERFETRAEKPVFRLFGILGRGLFEPLWRANIIHFQIRDVPTQIPGHAGHSLSKATENTTCVKFLSRIGSLMSQKNFAQNFMFRLLFRSSRIHSQDKTLCS